MSVRVLSPGLLSSVQSLGRRGYRHLGIGRSGALDTFSLEVANRLVGNSPDCAAIEMTLTGPHLHFTRSVQIAICGADIDAHIGDSAIPGWRRIVIPAHCELQFGQCRRGARAYLAVAGGFEITEVLGSRSTDLRAGFGGLHGRALTTGDMLSVAGTCAPTDTHFSIGHRWIDPRPDLDLGQQAIVHLLPGLDALTDPDALFASAWRVAAASNRQGLRLQGTPLTLADPGERVSEPVMPGTLQLPPDGHPILLLADAQTHGGYPRIGHAIAADQPRLAQLRPGESVQFVPCNHAQAQDLLIKQRQRLTRMAIAIEHME